MAIIANSKFFFTKGILPKKNPSNVNNSVTVHTTGQSGHAYHPHYDDMSSMWANIQYYSMLWDEQAITSEAEGHLVLKPK